jgi:hypothetical protein
LPGPALDCIPPTYASFVARTHLPRFIWICLRKALLLHLLPLDLKYLDI